MERLLSRWLGVRPSEQRRTLLLFSYLFLTTLFVILGRNARDTLYLTRGQVENLPWMYVGVALATTFAAQAWTYLLSARVSLRHLLAGSLTLVILFVMGCRALIVLSWAPVYPVFYIGMEAAGTLLVLQFWTFCHESFDAREARRLFGVIGSGGVLGAVFGGFGGGILAGILGTPNLMVMAVVALLGALLITQTVVPEGKGAAIVTGVEISREDDRVWQNPYAVFLAGIVVLLSVSVSLIDYQFKYEAHRHFDEEALAVLFGGLYGVCGLMSFGLHFLLTGRILVRMGILVPLVALPLVLFTFVFGMVLSPGFLPLLLAKGADTTLRYSLYDSVLQLLYIPLPVSSRRKVKAWIDGLLKPSAVAITGLGLLAVGELSSRQVGLLVMFLLVVWMVGAVRVRLGYSEALLASLSAGRSLPPSQTALDDMASTRALVEALRHSDDDTVCSALEMLPPLSGRVFAPYVLPLTTSGRERVRIYSIRFCVREGVEIPGEQLSTLLGDRSEEVRAEVVRALGIRGGGVVMFSGLLIDGSPRVRAAAAVQMALRGAGTAPLLAFARASADWQSRRWAAWGLGEVGLTRASRQLFSLLKDPVPEVQRAALEAVGKLGAPEFVEPVLQLLGGPLGMEAALSLANFGSALTPQLVGALRRAEQDEVYRFNLLHTLRLMGDPEMMEELIRHLPEDPEARLDLLKSAWATLRPRDGAGVALEVVEPRLRAEVVTCFQSWAILADVGEGPEVELLRGAMVEDQFRGMERLMLLLGLAFPSRSMNRIVHVFQGSRGLKSANAIEVLDGLLNWENRAVILPLLEDMPPSERLDRVSSLVPLRRQSRDQWLGELLGHADRWVVVSALEAVGRLGLVQWLERVDEVLRQSRDVMVRETAAVCLGRLVEDDEALALWRHLLDDPDGEVRRLARASLAQLEVSVTPAGVA